MKKIMLGIFTLCCCLGLSQDAHPMMPRLSTEDLLRISHQKRWGSKFYIPRSRARDIFNAFKVLGCRFYIDDRPVADYRPVDVYCAALILSNGNLDALFLQSVRTVIASLLKNPAEDLLLTSASVCVNGETILNGRSILHWAALVGDVKTIGLLCGYNPSSGAIVGEGVVFDENKKRFLNSLDGREQTPYELARHGAAWWLSECIFQDVSRSTIGKKRRCGFTGSSDLPKRWCDDYASAVGDLRKIR